MTFVFKVRVLGHRQMTCFQKYIQLQRLLV